MKSKLQYSHFLAYFIVFIFSSLCAFSSNNIESKKNYVFVENQGQYPANVKFVGLGADANLLITNESILFDFHNRSENGLKGHVLEMKFSGSNGLNNLDIVPTGSVRNYIIGNNQSEWKYGIKEYKEIYIRNIYQGIDTKLYFENGSPRYDFILAPNANPNQISIRLNGQENLSINDFNEVTIATSLGEVKHSKLFSYQNSENIKDVIKCNFKLSNGDITFNLGNYDKSKTLIIDPIVVSSFIGGSSIDETKCVKAVGDTSYVVAGWTESANLVTTVGAYQLNYGMNRDGFIAKYKIENGNLILVATTYLGSSGKDEINAMDIGIAGNIYVGGNTTSSDFPNINGLSNAYKGMTDVFVTKITPDLKTVLISNIFGGSNEDYLNCLVVNNKSAVIFGGQTSSADYYTKSGVQPIKNKNSDAFLTKLDENGILIDFSTFLGGSNDDVLNAISLFPSGDIGLVGSTLSTDFYIFPNVYVAPKPFPPDPGYSQYPYDNSQNGGWDAFAAKLAPDGASYEYSTFFGGSSDDFGKAVIGLNDGTMLIAGESIKETQNAKFPTSDAAFQKTNKGGKDLFLALLGPEVITTGKNKSQLLIFSTFIGGGSDDELFNMSANNLAGSVGLVGRTKSADFPKSNGTQKYAGGYDGFVLEMSNNGAGLVYGALLGGNLDDVINDIEYDSEGDYYIAGSTQSSSIPLFGSNQINGTSDGFSAKYVNGSLGILNPTPGGTYCNGTILNINWDSQDLSASGYNVELGRKSSSTLTMLASKVKLNNFGWQIPNNIEPATDYFLKISHQSGMVSILNGTFKINVPPVINSVTNAGSSTFTCEGQPIQFYVDATGSNLTYQWKLNGKDVANQTSSTFKKDKSTIADNGSYTVVVKGECAPDPESKPIVFQVGPTTKFANQLSDGQMELTKEFTLTATALGGIKLYKWQKDRNDMLGQTSEVLKITNPSKADEGYYRCIIHGDCGKDTSNEAHLTMKPTGDVYYSNSKSDKIMLRYVSENAITIQLGNLVDGNVKLNLFNTNGQLISNLIDQSYFYGIVSYELDLEKYSTGIYFLKLDNANESSIKTLQVIK